MTLACIIVPTVLCSIHAGTAFDPLSEVIIGLPRWRERRFRPLAPMPPAPLAPSSSSSPDLRFSFIAFKWAAESAWIEISRVPGPPEPSKNSGNPNFSIIFDFSSSDMLANALRCSSVMPANAARCAADMVSYLARSSGESFSSSAAGRPPASPPPPRLEEPLPPTLMGLPSAPIISGTPIVSFMYVARSSALIDWYAARASSLIEAKAARSASLIFSYSRF